MISTTLLQKGVCATLCIRLLHSTPITSMSIQIGQHLPDILVQEGDPENRISMAQLFKGKKGVLFGIPGAFTPGCSKSHLPGFIQMSVNLRVKGVTEIACVSVNDVFVMAAFGKHHRADGRVRMLADPTGAFTKAIGLSLNDDQLTQVLGNVRSQRYAMLIEDGVVRKLNLEPDGTGLSCSLAPNFLQEL